MEDKIPLKPLLIGLGIAGGLLAACQGLYLGTKYARSGNGSLGTTMQNLIDSIKEGISKMKQKHRRRKSKSDSSDSDDSGVRYMFTEEGKKDYLRTLKRKAGPAKRRRRRARRGKKPAKRQRQQKAKKEMKEESETLENTEKKSHADLGVNDIPNELKEPKPE